MTTMAAARCSEAHLRQPFVKVTPAGSLQPGFFGGNHGEWILLRSPHQLPDATALLGNAVKDAFKATQHFMTVR